MRRAAKVDDNHRAVVEAFRALGCLVQSLAAIGKGCPDLLVAVPDYDRSQMSEVRRLIVCEVKDGSKPPSARKLTPDEVAWHAAWAGAPIFVVTSVADVLRVIEEARS